MEHTYTTAAGNRLQSIFDIVFFIDIELQSHAKVSIPEAKLYVLKWK